MTLLERMKRHQINAHCILRSVASQIPSQEIINREPGLQPAQLLQTAAGENSIHFKYMKCYYSLLILLTLSKEEGGTLQHEGFRPEYQPQELWLLPAPSPVHRVEG